MELIQGSETSANHNLTPGKYPKENIQYSNHGESLKSRIIIFCKTQLFEMSPRSFLVLLLHGDSRHKLLSFSALLLSMHLFMSSYDPVLWGLVSNHHWLARYINIRKFSVKFTAAFTAWWILAYHLIKNTQCLLQTSHFQWQSTVRKTICDVCDSPQHSMTFMLVPN